MGWGWATSSTWGLLFIRELTECCKKKDEEQVGSSHLTLCFFVFVCLYSLKGGFMQVCVCVFVFARQNISCFFSSPLDFPALGRELYFRKHRVWKYPVCLGKIYHACLFFVQEWIWQSHNWGSSVFLSVFVWQSTLRPTPLWWPQVNLRYIGVLVPENGHTTLRPAPVEKSSVSYMKHYLIQVSLEAVIY